MFVDKMFKIKNVRRNATESRLLEVEKGLKSRSEYVLFIITNSI